MKIQKGNHPTREDENVGIKKVVVETTLKDSLRMTKDLSLKTPQPRSLKVVEEV